MTRSSDVPAGRLSIAIAIVGFGAVATAQATNMILARANGGYIPPFALAFFRWAIVAFGLLPLSFAELHTQQKAVRSRWWQILVTGFLGMFVCGGPIYIAGVTTTAINIGLIMAMSPIVVLVVSWWTGLETIAGLQRLGIGSDRERFTFVSGVAGSARRGADRGRRSHIGRDVARAEEVN